MVFVQYVTVIIVCKRCVQEIAGKAVELRELFFKDRKGWH